MQHNLLLSLLLLVVARLCICSYGQPAGISIRYIDHTYRKYVPQHSTHPWKNGVDIFTKRGYSMVPVLGDVSDQPVTEIETALGAVGLSASTPFVLQDFHAAYKIPTIWPYCESTKKCLVYNQPQSPAFKDPITITLPPGVSALDFYLDAAIDCVTTLRAVVSCKLLVQPGAIGVKVKVTSICASPNVGKYIGFLDEDFGDIESVTIKCKSTYPNAIGLMRVGSRKAEQ